MSYWKPKETIPQDGRRVLIGVWEGSWREPRQAFRVFEARCHRGFQTWSRSYRTEEGEAYEIAGWSELPDPPEESL